MEVVLRPSNDAFLKEVVFPALELAVTDKTPAIDHLLQHLADEEVRGLLEVVAEHVATRSLAGTQDERWSDAIYRLLFHEWIYEGDGWVQSRPFVGYAGPWEESFHLSLMLEDPDYPYFDEERADLYRRAFWGQPKKHVGLCSLMCGAWDPVPAFPPDLVLTTEGNGLYSPQTAIARADWAWRPMYTVSDWAARMPSALNRLLDREVKRLHPIDPPERFELLDYWLGRTQMPPVLAVSFSGLGPSSHDWIREIGQLAQLVRRAAAEQYGLTAVISRYARRADRGSEDDD